MKGLLVKQYKFKQIALVIILVYKRFRKFAILKHDVMKRNSLLCVQDVKMAWHTVLLTFYHRVFNLWDSRGRFI